jgi:hypothetical protein
MINTSVSKTATGTSAAIPVDYHCTGTSPLGLALDFTTVAAVGTASVEFTFDGYDAVAAATAVWLPIASMAGKTATVAVGEVLPAKFVRLNVTAYTSGTITLRVNQGDAK